MLQPLEAFQALESQNEQFYRDYDAWYSGSENKLKMRSRTGDFWRQSKRCTRKVHVPIAAEISSVSADLLFAEPPSVFIVSEQNSDQAQQRLDRILSVNRFNAKGYAAAETCSAYGDVYIKINWDGAQSDVPMLNVVQASNAYAEYQFDVLKCIHFFAKSQIAGKSDRYDWLYERYEPGRIITHRGTGSASSPETFDREGDELKLKSSGILAVHIPNLTPNRNGNPNLGRSDYNGIMGMMDALDEAWSSWIRDVNLGKARLIVPRDYFRTDVTPLQPGEFISHFDKEDEVYVAMDVDPDRSNGTGIEKTQFEIRASQHQETCIALLERIVTSAGYSPQTFGINIAGTAESGTALNVRERRTYTNKAKKELYWKNALEMLFAAVIETDKEAFQQPYPDDACISVEFKEPAQDANNIAEAIYNLDRSGAISLYEKVKRTNPDWDDAQIQEETDRIGREKGLLVDNPFEASAAFAGEDES